MKTTMIAVLGGLALAALAPGAVQPAAAQDAPRVDLTQTYPGESYAQARRYYYGRPGPRYYRRGYSGGAAAAGVLGGLAAGAIIGGAIASQGAAAAPLPKTEDPDFIAYCSRKYRTFDPIDGTYLASDGRRYMCQ